MTNFIAESIFWGFGVLVAIAVYQGAVLPGIRLSLRYRTFELRDQLRTSVMRGGVRESDQAFQLLHQQLNYMCVSLSRYDLARLVQNTRTLDEEGRARAATAHEIVESGPAEVRAIYEESLQIYVKALIFNSLFFFAITTACLGLVLLARVGARHLWATLVSRVHEDSKLGFFTPEMAAV